MERLHTNREEEERGKNMWRHEIRTGDPIYLGVKPEEEKDSL